MKATKTKAAPTRTHAAVEVVESGEAAVLFVSGLVDERFAGFGDVGPVKAVVINVAGITRMSSFGVRQWLKAIDSLPKSVAETYLLGCPTFFVDQLNMVLNFGGQARVLTVVAPFTCTSCGLESGETVDVFAERAVLAQGGLAPRTCSKCQGKLELDESP